MKSRDAAARQLVKDETIKSAFDAVAASLATDLFNAPTPDERERIFQERQAVARAWQQLQLWASNQTLKDQHEH